MQAWTQFEPPDHQTRQEGWSSVFAMLQVFVRTKRNCSSNCTRRECSQHGETRRIYCSLGPPKQVLRRTRASWAVMCWSLSTASLRFSSKVDKMSSMTWPQKIAAPNRVAYSRVTWRKPPNCEFEMSLVIEITSLFSALKDKPKICPFTSVDWSLWMLITQWLVGIRIIYSRDVIGSDDTNSSFDIAIFDLRHHRRCQTLIATQSLVLWGCWYWSAAYWEEKEIELTKHYVYWGLTLNYDGDLLWEVHVTWPTELEKCQPIEHVIDLSLGMSKV